MEIHLFCTAGWWRARIQVVGGDACLVKKFSLETFKIWVSEGTLCPLISFFKLQGRGRERWRVKMFLFCSSHCLPSELWLYFYLCKGHSVVWTNQRRIDGSYPSSRTPPFKAGKLGVTWQILSKECFETEQHSIKGNLLHKSLCFPYAWNRKAKAGGTVMKCREGLILEFF
jgi:hypothetical protein